MNDKRVFVCFTMDCETLQGRAGAGGPADWKLAEQAMRGYVEYLADRGYSATLFLVPETAEVLSHVAQDLAAAGADIGSHMHPQDADVGYDGYLGEFDYDTQWQILGRARDRFAQAIGFAPTSFRPGNFSANNHTFSVLVDLGYRQGSVSLPGRQIAKIAARWDGAEPFAHWANGNDYKRAGNLDFLELPCTAHPQDASHPREGVDPRHLRLERDDFCEYGRQIVEQSLDMQIANNHPLKVIVAMTHNTRDYGNPAEPARQHLQWLLDTIEQAAAARGLELVPATLARIRAAAVALPLHPDAGTG